MTEKELLYFKTVADERSISAAAKKLFIAQPSLTQCIKRVESSCGMPLFTRTSKGLVLTYAGERYYVLASEILRMLDSFSMEVSDISKLKAGQLKLGITRYLGPWLLPKVLPKYKRLYPNIKLEIVEGTSAELEKRLLGGSLDFAIMHSPSPENTSPSLDYDFFGIDNFYIVAPPDSHLSEKAVYADSSVEDGNSQMPELDIRVLRDEAFVMVAKGQRSREFCDSLLLRAGISNPKIEASFSNLNTVYRCVAAGLGIAILPEYCIESALYGTEALCFSIPASYHASWSMCIASLKEGHITVASRSFIELVKGSI